MSTIISRPAFHIRAQSLRVQHLMSEHNHFAFSTSHPSVSSHFCQKSLPFALPDSQRVKSSALVRSADPCDERLEVILVVRRESCFKRKRLTVRVLVRAHGGASSWCSGWRHGNRSERTKTASLQCVSAGDLSGCPFCWYESRSGRTQRASLQCVSAGVLSGGSSCPS
jgi:hypothetical protein